MNLFFLRAASAYRVRIKMAFAFLGNNACAQFAMFQIHSLETICVIYSVFLQA